MGSIHKFDVEPLWKDVIASLAVSGEEITNALLRKVLKENEKWAKLSWRTDDMIMLKERLRSYVKNPESPVCVQNHPVGVDHKTSELKSAEEYAFERQKAETEVTSVFFQKNEGLRLSHFLQSDILLEFERKMKAAMFAEHETQNDASANLTDALKGIVAQEKKRIVLATKQRSELEAEAERVKQIKIALHRKLSELKRNEVCTLHGRLLKR